MKLAVMLIMGLSGFVGLLGIGYSVGDMIYEKVQQAKARRAEPEPVSETVPESVPEFVPVPEEAPIPIVEEVSAEEADALMSDEQALSAVTVETLGKKTEGLRAYINIGTLNARFAPGALVTLAILQERGLVSPKAKRIKILADGTLNRPLTVEAHGFSIQALKMIRLTGGTAVQKR